MLQKDALARLRGFRLHQPRRRGAQCAAACRGGRRDGAHQCRTGGKQRYGGVEGGDERRHGVENTVGGENDGGENLEPDEQPQNAAAHGGKPRIQKIVRSDHAAGIAEGKQRADLCALLLHKARHGGERHKRRHQEEKHGEHLGDSLHLFRVAVEADIADIGVAVEDIPGALGDVVDLFLRVGELFRRIGKRLVGGFLRGGIVGFCRFQLFCALFLTLLALGKGSLAVLQRLLHAEKLRLCGGKFLFGIFLLGLQRRVRRVQFCCGSGKRVGVFLPYGGLLRVSGLQL